MTTKTSIPALAALATLALAPSAMADRHVAPGGATTGNCSVQMPCSSIQRAVDHAAPGERVQLATALYNQSVVIAAKDVALAGAGATIKASGAQPTVAVHDNAKAQIADVTIIGDGVALDVDTGADVGLSRVIARAGTEALDLDGSVGISSVSAHDSVFAAERAEGTPRGATATASSGSAQLLLVRSTVAAGNAFTARALTAATNESGATVGVELRDTALWTPGATDLRASQVDGAPVTVTSTGSAYRIVDATGGATVAPAAVTADPGFATPSQLMPPAGSPLVDAGDPAAPQGQDVQRTSRPLDGDGNCQARSDIGAYERPAAEAYCLDPGTVGPITAHVPQLETKPRGPILQIPQLRIAARVMLAPKPIKSFGKLRFHLNMAAGVNLTIEKARVSKCQGGRLCFKYTHKVTRGRDGKKGVNVVKLRTDVGGKPLPNGRYRLRINAQKGTMKAQERTVAFRIER